MKFFAKVMAVLMVVSMLSVAAFADDFVGSVQKNDGFEVIDGDVTIVSPADDEVVNEVDKNELEDLIDGFGEKWAQITGAPIDNAKVVKTFDVDIPGNSATITLKVDGLGDKFVLIGKNTATGEWKFIDFTRDGDKITFTLDGDYSLVIVEDNGNAPVVDKPVQSPQTGVESVSAVLAVSTVALLAAAVVLFKKSRTAA